MYTIRTITAALVLTMLFNACKENKETTKSNYAVNSEKSSIKWKGSAPTHYHIGTFNVEGDISTENDAVTNGEFTFPISSITNTDLPEGPNQELISHLSSPDFFNLALHPYAKFKITKVTPVSENDHLNYNITGDFTLIGQTHELSFPAKIEFSNDSLKTTANFTFNRLKWGMESFNDPNEKLYILPEIEITLDIHSAKKD
ncbi:YceI family protein [Pseudopedobacter saltans DSM 12145]|uniref:YceI family protein n=1 Tax=Pseudopedobacter saltans (strain ATCC 51119 / DSM 12145 / JCM 21818 / CCUG 39354 / LMG 10337 / NBRC 100064 / NCIMB 13643) TaxID=762903 RepID=F0S686_PSESL|nr:YceI family protein [Pseudopedobacter saltans]ADY53200.1 YceI family protein [Pseudopedobacter saltans DSM 12145]